jgi:fatty acid desaturase
MTSLSSVSMTLPRPRPGLTLVLGVVLALASVSSSAAYAVGAISFLAHLCVAVPCLYFLCICIHDGVHGVFLKDRRIGNAAGFLLSLVIALPFPLLQSAHLKHHRVIAQRERRRGSVVDVDEHDPEAIVYEASLPALLLRLPFIPLWYLRSVRDMRASSVALTALHLGIVGMVVVLLFEHGVDVMMVWAAPVLVAIGWFGFTTVYVPHGPHAKVLMRVFNAHSGWHHDHHRSPQFPFHQYAAVRALHLEHAHGDGARAHDPVVFFWARRVW